MKLLKKRPYLGFLAPAFLLYTFFIIVPIFCAAYYSLHEWSGIGPMEFIGAGNYKQLFFEPRTSSTFFNALGNSVKYTVCTLLIIMPVQVFFAYMLNIKVRGHKYFQLMIFLPYVISTTIIGFFALIVFDPNIGFMNEFLGAVGLDSLQNAWFGNPKIAFSLLVGVILWNGVGSGMMIFFANMKEIPESLIEASTIDGAGGWTRFFHVILPLMGPSFTTNIVLSTIYGLTQFDLPYLIGGPNGGIDNTLDFVNLFFYRYTFGSSYFGETSLGFGASISVTMFVLIFAVSIVQRKLLKQLEVDS